jgi:4a-hydroxytetrahydrobiopterin dehydratase
MSHDTTKLSSEALQQFLSAHPAWGVEGGMLVRTYELPTFLEGIAFVQRVAQAAEEADHHPDIDIRWRKVTLRLVTHDADGLTARDTRLAARADALVQGR